MWILFQLQTIDPNAFGHPGPSSVDGIPNNGRSIQNLTKGCF